MSVISDFATTTTPLYIGITVWTFEIKGQIIKVVFCQHIKPADYKKRLNWGLKNVKSEKSPFFKSAKHLADCFVLLSFNVEKVQTVMPNYI